MTKHGSVSEQFDINCAELEGVVQRIWNRDADVFVRLAVYDAHAGGNAEGAAMARFATLRIAEGALEGKCLILQPGDQVRTVGYLVDSPYTETMRQFLDDARHPHFLEEVPDAAPWKAVRVKRIGTLVETQTLVSTRVEAGKCFNRCTVQGIVSKVWESHSSLFARLAIYDEHTAISQMEGKKGWPRRIPHYVTVQFPQGRVGDKPIHLKPKNRLRAVGYLNTRFYEESLREVLLRAKKVHLLATLPNSDSLAEISALRTATYVLAQSVIVFASLKRKE